MLSTLIRAGTSATGRRQWCHLRPGRQGWSQSRSLSSSTSQPPPSDAPSPSDGSRSAARSWHSGTWSPWRGARRRPDLRGVSFPPDPSRGGWIARYQWTSFWSSPGRRCGCRVAGLGREYVELVALLDQFLLGGEDDAGGEVDDAVGAGAEEVVPDAAGGLDAGEDVCEPGQHPGDDEDDQVHLPEALKDLFELLVSPEQQREHHVADLAAQSADVVGQEVPEVGLACLFEQVVALVVAEQHDEDRGHVMEPLDVLQLLVLTKKTVQDPQYVLLPFLTG